MSEESHAAKRLRGRDKLRKGSSGTCVNSSDFSSHCIFSVLIALFETSRIRLAIRGHFTAPIVPWLLLQRLEPQAESELQNGGSNYKTKSVFTSSAYCDGKRRGSMSYNTLTFSHVKVCI